MKAFVCKALGVVEEDWTNTELIELDFSTKPYQIVAKNWPTKREVLHGYN
jgi:hypothetical protein